MLAKHRGVETVTRVAKMAMLRTMGRSDYERWANPGNLEEWWESRAQRLAAQELVERHVVPAVIRPLSETIANKQ